MNRSRILFVALAAGLLAVAMSIVVVWLTTAPMPVPTSFGLSAPLPLVEIPPGEFLMGSPASEAGRLDNETQHSVKITYAFKMGKSEVTQQQWCEVMATTIQQQRDKAQARPSLRKRLKRWGKAIKANPFCALDAIWRVGVWKTIKGLAVGEEHWSLSGEGDDHPMYYVSWDEAMDFCRRLTEQEREAGRLSAGMMYRLPTEAEWEYACRAGSTTRFANGDTEADLDKISWYDGNSGGTSHPVETKFPNAWGLHDMHGNVWEWCYDWYEDYPAGEAVDPFGPATGSVRVFRSGCWFNLSRNCRSAYRIRDVPGFRIDFLGFRVVLAPVRPR
jgi:formylglycine-generating enzyme required for sulfatase activity